MASSSRSRLLNKAEARSNSASVSFLGVAFETAIIERYRRRESSVEEALIEMYLAGVSVRRGEEIIEVKRTPRDTYQFNDYSKYDVSLFDEKHKAEVREKQFPIDCQKAFDLGIKLIGEAKKMH